MSPSLFVDASSIPEEFPSDGARKTEEKNAAAAAAAADAKNENTENTESRDHDDDDDDDDDEEFSTPPKTTTREAIVCVHTVVHRSKIGVVIGFRGRTIVDIERRTGASVSIVREEEEEKERDDDDDDDDDEENVVKVVLTGTAKMCKEAARIIETIADGNIVDDDDDDKKQVFGRRSVSISKTNGGKLRPLEKVFLGWTRAGEEEEKEEEEDEENENVISTDAEEENEGYFYNHPALPPSPHRKTLPPYERDAARFFGTLASLTVRIPDSKVALIIGKQGAHIEFLRHMTGCSLNMASEVVDVGQVFLNKDEHIFQAATNIVERVLLMESSSLTDCARCAALVADIVEGNLHIQSKKRGGGKAAGFSSNDDDAMLNMKEIHVSVRECASVSTKKTFHVKAKGEAKRTFMVSSAQQQKQRRYQCTSTTSTQSRRMSTSSSPERHINHQTFYRARHEQEQEQHYSSSSYYDYYLATAPSLKFDPITNALLGVVPPPVAPPPPPSSINVNIDGDDYFCANDESDAYSTDSDFAA